jgi:hypothetical protein
LIKARTSTAGSLEEISIFLQLSEMKFDVVNNTKEKLCTSDNLIKTKVSCYEKLFFVEFQLIPKSDEIRLSER